MKHMSLLVALAAAFVAGACTGTPDSPPSGFLSDYSKLVQVEGSTARWIDETAGPFNTLIVEPIQVRVPADHLDDEQREDLRVYGETALKKAATDAGYVLTEAPGEGVARVRIAITDVNKTAWWTHIHPLSNVSGIGAGGLAVEAEIIDTMTNAQTVAVVRSFGRGSWIQLPSFSRLSDARNAIDTWAQEATLRLRRFREMRNQPVDPGDLEE